MPCLKEKMKDVIRDKLVIFFNLYEFITIFIKAPWVGVKLVPFRNFFNSEI